MTIAAAAFANSLIFSAPAFLNPDLVLRNYQALPDQVIQYPTQTLINGLQARKLGLFMRITPDAFRKEVIHLRCSATLLITYQFEAIRVITGGSGDSIDSSGQLSASVQRTKEAPIITGGRSKYRIGDWINLNCSTSADDVHLKWYINGNDVRRQQFIRHFEFSCVCMYI
jgi:hypothetical protein